MRIWKKNIKPRREISEGMLIGVGDMRGVKKELVRDSRNGVVSMAYTENWWRKMRRALRRQVNKQKNVRKESEEAKIEDRRSTKMGTLIRP